VSTIVKLFSSLTLPLFLPIFLSLILFLANAAQREIELLLNNLKVDKAVFILVLYPPQFYSCFIIPVLTEWPINGKQIWLSKVVSSLYLKVSIYFAFTNFLFIHLTKLQITLDCLTF